MQPLTAAPRDTLTAAQVRGVLTAPAVAFDYGVDLLDGSLNYVAALDVTACTVSHDATALVQGTVDLTTTYKLKPGDRVRPWITISDGITTARFNLGVYTPETPKALFGQLPLLYETIGYDALSQLARPLSDNWVTPVGANVLAEVQRALAAAAFTYPTLIDSTASASNHPTGKAWPADGQNTYLTVVNGLLAVITYAGVWPDWDGNLRTGPFVPATQRAIEWSFTVGDPAAGIVTDDPQVTNDVYAQPNQWVFVMSGITGDPQDGVSRFVYDNLDTGPSSQAALAGRVNTAAPVTLDAVSYASLVTQGTALALQQIRSTETIPVTSRKFPLLWHNDIAGYSYPKLGGQRVMQSTSWKLPLHDLSQMDSTWGTVSGS